MTPEFDELPIPFKTPAEVAAQLRSQMGLANSATIPASQNGGANYLLQFDSAGNIVTGDWENKSNNVTFGGVGNVIIPDMQGVRWLKKDGTLSGASIRMWEDHDAWGGELLIVSPYRIALIGWGQFQFGDNSSAWRPMHVAYRSGEATATRTIRHSPAQVFETRTYTSGPNDIRRFTAFQAVPLDASQSKVALRFYHNAAVTHADSSPASWSQSSGLLTGDLSFEILPDGFWSPGLNPPSVALDDAPTITFACTKYKARQVGHVTLTDDRTLEIEGAENGMAGTLLVSQDGTGGHSLTWPDNTAAPAGFGVNQTSHTTSRLDWIFHGGKFYVHLEASYPLEFDPVTESFLTRASITDDVISMALNQLVLDLKATGIYEKAYAIYPWVGGTATAHAQCLKNAYNGSFAGSPTHNANGITGNATDARFLTGFVASSVGAQNSLMVATYCRTQSPTASRYFFGATGSDSSRVGAFRSGDNIGLAGVNSNTISGAVVAGGDFRKHFGVQRESASLSQIFSESLWGGGYSNSSLSACDREIMFLCRNFQGTPGEFTNANLAFGIIAQHFTESEWNTYRGIVTAFQTALGRANP